MTMTTPSRSHTVDRHERTYRRLLVAYPRDFRDEYGEDLAQSFRDLMVFASDGRGMWWRTIRDLIPSAVKERRSMFSGDRKPSKGAIFVLVVVGFVVLAVGLATAPGSAIGSMILLNAFLLVWFGLPTYGITRFRRAWLVRRTTGGPVAQHLALGAASFVPAAVILVLLNDDVGYLIFITIGLTAIVGSGLGIIWALIKLTTSGRQRLVGRKWVKPTLVLVPSLAILGFIIGASYNSYRQSLGPPGDHSVAGASADTRALWQAANDGDVDEIVRLTTETCADPWVKFNSHNAKGEAETRELHLPDEFEPPFREISGILGDYMDVWEDRCSRFD